MNYGSRFFLPNNKAYYIDLWYQTQCGSYVESYDRKLSIHWGDLISRALTSLSDSGIENVYCTAAFLWTD